MRLTFFRAQLFWLKKKTIALEKQFKVFQLYIKYLNSLLDKIQPISPDLNLKQAIKQFERKNPQLGSRDRRFIQHVIYGFFRWLPIVSKRARLETIALIILLEKLATPAWRQFFVEHEKLEFSESFIAELGDSTSLERQLAAINAALGTAFAETDLFPEWMREHLPQNEDIRQLAAAFQMRAPIGVWSTRKKPAELLKNHSDLAENAAPHPRLKGALVFAPESPIKNHPIYTRGLVEIQDIASQMIVAACQASQGEFWWDACAGGGGKALHLAKHMNFTGKILASDLRGYMLKETQRRAKKLGAKGIRTKQVDLTKPLADLPKFDGILIDAPCSGSGTWKRHPQLRWQMSESELPKLQELQFALLTNAATRVKENGVLVYSTCSVFEAENESVVARFLKENAEFELEPMAHPLTGEQTNGMMRSRLETGIEDGMFAARMRRLKCL